MPSALNEDIKVKLLSILKTTFGYDSFRLEQENIIDAVIAGHDTLAIMPTGGGKSICYQLPALHFEGTTLVISPLISLMQDQVNSLKQNGIAAAFLNSSLDAREKREIENQLKEGKLKLLYVAPEAIVSGSLMYLIKTIKISLIAIDEAHCVSQWGHEFRPDYTQLHILKEHFPDTPVLALTATADARTRDDISQQLGLLKPKTFISSFDRPNIHYSIFERDNEIKQLDKFIKRFHADDTGIVYCLSRKKVEKTCKDLKKLGHNAVPYHAGLDAKIRKKNQERFDSEDNLIVVATIAFGMGIDRPDVRFVAHLDLPKSIESYYQETGRAGRDGKPANAWMVYGLSDVVKLSRMIETTEASESYKKISRHKLNLMLGLCETISCRRQNLLNYFGQDLPEPCGNCDACKNPPELWDASVEAQKFMSAIFRTEQRFGASYIIDVLRGSAIDKIIERKHNKLSVYGIGRELSKNDWNHIVRQLLSQGYIQIQDWEYRTLALTEKSWPILKGEKKIKLRKLRAEKSGGISKRKVSVELESHGREELFEALRRLRKEIATELKIPPYMVFGDKSLHDMCQILPRDPDEFLSIHGVGQNKMEKFGNQFLEVIREAP